MNLNKLRLQGKIFAFLLGFCALLIGLLWLFQTVFLNDMYRFIRRQELRQAMQEVEREIDSAALQSVFLRIQQERDITVMPTPDFAPEAQAEPEAPGRRRGPPPVTITEVREFALRDGTTLSLTFFARVVPVEATISTLRVQLYWITGAMVAFSVLLAIVIARRVARPIEEVTRGAADLARGNYGVRFCGKGFYEIVELSETLNAAAVELGRVETLRRELLANVSHDLRTPLALIYGYAEMMHDFPKEITSEQTRVIMEEARRLGALVNDVLDLSRLEADMERLDVSRFNLTRGLSAIIDRVGALLQSEGYEIIFSHDADIFVEADEMKIGRAFYNLLVNAVNYSGCDKTIHAAQVVTDGFVRVTVADSGEGIAPEELPVIWERYYKSGKAHARAVAGTGLGLSIVKRILELHGGTYGVASEPGQGSTFWFQIPRADP